MTTTLVVAKLELPSFLKEICTPEAYWKWIKRRALAHVKRDQKRGNRQARWQDYIAAMHDAVVMSRGCCAYTGLPLRWDLISTYKSEESQKGRRAYKKGFADLPTVDHVDDGLGTANFRICSWRINDAKSDMSLEEFVKVCQAVVDHSKRL